MAKVMNMARYTLPLIIFVGLATVLWFGLGLNPRELPSQLLDKPAPKFSLPSDDNINIDERIFQGKISLLNVWSTQCINCLYEHKLLLELQDTANLQLLGLNYKDDAATVRAWLKDNGNPYQQVMLDQHGLTAIDWGVYGTPETFVVDRHGIIRYRYAGTLTMEQWTAEIKPLVSRLQDES